MDATTVEGVSILVLVALSAVFSGLESALFSFSEVRLRSLEDELGALPRMLQLWRDQPNDVLATTLIANNVVNITASALATDLTERLLRGSSLSGWGIPVAVGGMTLLILIFGEVVPKTFAKHNPRRYLALLPLLRLFYVIAYPAMRVLVSLTTRVLGDRGESEGMTVTEDDIETLVKIGKQDGSIAPEATRLLTGVLELDEKIAREVMVPRTEVEGLPIDADLDHIMARVRETGFSRYPVFDGSIDNVVGVLYVKDILTTMNELESGDHFELAKVIRPPMIRPENIGVQRLLVEMKRERVHLVILASEYGGIEGLVTLEDIVEEVFGPIYDEHDTQEVPFALMDDGSFVLDGICTLADLEAQCGVELKEDEDYETLNGLLMKASGTVPEAGYKHEQEGCRFEVLESDATRVLKVHLSVLAPSSTEDGEGRPRPDPNTESGLRRLHELGPEKETAAR